MKEFPRMGYLDTTLEISHFLVGVRYVPPKTLALSS
jgi:hypothetical protein